MNFEKETEQEFIDRINEIKNTKPPKKQNPGIIIIAVAVAICVLTFFGPSLFSSPEPTGPWGKIISPASRTTTSRDITVTLETRNIEPGQYICLAVDKPDLGLCWPKRPRLVPNYKLRTTIQENGPTGTFTLSLYLVNKTINDQWKDWIDRKLHGGLPMPPERKRLDSVVLALVK